MAQRNRHRVAAQATIPAPPERVYGILADYREGHAAILPHQYFKHFTVESGGTGAGTVIRFAVRAAGRTRTVRASVAEPEPGRTLAETDLDRGGVTTFTVDSSAEGAASLVTISTELAVRNGLPGAIERWMTAQVLRRIYRQELEQLARYAGERL